MSSALQRVCWGLHLCPCTRLGHPQSCLGVRISRQCGAAAGGLVIDVLVSQEQSRGPASTSAAENLKRMCLKVEGL